MNSKKFYFSVIFISFISGFILLITLKANNRKINPNLLSNIYSIFNESLTNSTTHNIKMGYNTSIPFDINIKETGECISLNGKIINFNKICVDDISNVIEIMNKVFDKNNSYSINIYKHIVFRYLVDYRDKTDYSNIFEKIAENLEINEMNIFLKYLYYNNQTKLISNDFYKNLKKFNAKSVFEELRDQDSINIIIYNSTDNNIYYNEDINQDIIELNINNNDSLNLLKNNIQFRMIKIDLKKDFKDKNYLTDLVKFLNSKEITYYRLFLETIKNLETYNKFASNYESVKTFDRVKDKVLFY
jgi:hypothetical protein